jgi:hypothetical protein
MDGRDTFSIASGAYASDRPQYPTELFAWLATQCESRQTAWDCATGNGQAARGLAQHFERVEATDISAEQIEHGVRDLRISYSVQSAEATKFAAESFDLVAVAQALHWFHLERFWAEVRRTARANAFFCAWGYAWFECDMELEAFLFAPIRQVLEPYWASENGILWRGYQSEEILFPFRRVEAPTFAIELSWEIQAILRHLHTWSSYKRAVIDPEAARSIARIERDALERFRSSTALPLRAPLFVAAGWVS